MMVDISFVDYPAMTPLLLVGDEVPPTPKAGAIMCTSINSFTYSLTY